MILSIAGLFLIISKGDDRLSLDYSPCHEKFLITENELDQNNPAPTHTLMLEIIDSPVSPQAQLIGALCKNEIWELWQDEFNHYVFTQPKQSPQRWVFIDPEFRNGKIIGDFSPYQQNHVYPLQYIDIVIFSNWLANFGDMILHASGIAFNGEGFCFIGHSRAGKSTLVGDIANIPGVTVLGEDQVVLRKIDNHFMIYGTPWHERLDMCSPMGVPLKKIFFLDRNASQVIAPVRDFDAVVKILQTAFFPVYRPEAVQGILARLSSLAGNVRINTLAYERGTNVLKVILEA